MVLIINFQCYKDKINYSLVVIHFTQLKTQSLSNDLQKNPYK